MAACCCWASYAWASAACWLLFAACFDMPPTTAVAVPATTAVRATVPTTLGRPTRAIGRLIIFKLLSALGAGQRLLDRLGIEPVVGDQLAAGIAAGGHQK